MRRASRWVGLAAAAAAACTGPLMASEMGRPVGVVELFTSQGCSSCPPADAVFAELAKRDDVVALSYHVSYWDYLGWKDTLATTENTERQYAYMRAFGSRSVYTPQAVINGRVHVNGAKGDAVLGKLEELGQAGGMSVGMKVTRSGESVKIEAAEGAGPDTEAHVVLVYFDAPKAVKIPHGENGGKTVTYYNSVSGIQTAGMWHGKAATYELPASEIAKKAAGCAVLLQSVGSDGAPGPILGAVVINRPRPE